MTKIEFSEHATNDRTERIVRIATTIGFGEEIAQFNRHNKYGKTVHCLTSTGVVIIKDYTQSKIITMYAMTLAQMLTYYNKSRAPQVIYRAVVNNEKKRKFLFEI